MSLLKLNGTNPGVRRPLRIADLQNIWDGIDNALALGTETTPHIICGFDWNADTQTFSAGVVAFQNKLWLHPDVAPNTIGNNQAVYAATVDTDNDIRVFADGQEYDFSYDRIAMTSAQAGAPLIGTFNVSTVDKWKTAYIGGRAITGYQIDDSTITGAKIAENTITASNIADGAVGSSQLGNNSITNNHLTQNAVRTANIADASVTTAKLANASVTSEKMADNAVGFNVLRDQGVTTAKLANAAVTETKIANGAVTQTKIADSSVTAAKLATNAVTTDKMVSNAVTANKMSAGTAPSITSALPNQPVSANASYSLSNLYNAGSIGAATQGNTISEALVITSNSVTSVSINTPDTGVGVEAPPVLYIPVLCGSGVTATVNVTFNGGLSYAPVPCAQSVSATVTGDGTSTTHGVIFTLVKSITPNQANATQVYVCVNVQETDFTWGTTA